MVITVKYQCEITKTIQGSLRLLTPQKLEKGNHLQDCPILPFNSHAVVNTKDSFMNNFSFFPCLMILSTPVCNIIEITIRLSLVIQKIKILRTCFTAEAPTEHLSPLPILRQNRTTFHFKTYTKVYSNFPQLWRISICQHVSLCNYARHNRKFKKKTCND